MLHGAQRRPLIGFAIFGDDPLAGFIEQVDPMGDDAAFSRTRPLDGLGLRRMTATAAAPAHPAALRHRTECGGAFPRGPNATAAPPELPRRPEVGAVAQRD